MEEEDGVLVPEDILQEANATPCHLKKIKLALFLQNKLF
jgi:hypothetical protein